MNKTHYSIGFFNFQKFLLQLEIFHLLVFHFDAKELTLYIDLHSRKDVSDFGLVSAGINYTVQQSNIIKW